MFSQILILNGWFEVFYNKNEKESKLKLLYVKAFFIDTYK